MISESIKRSLYSSLLILVSGLVGCTDSRSPVAPAATPLKPVVLNETVQIIEGQTLYVPVYSQIYTWAQDRTIDLTTTLSIRNTDAAHPLILTAVDYYDGNGQLVRKYLEQSVELGSLAATNFVVPQTDASGGLGAFFMVEWVTQIPVSDPVIESIMVNTSGNQGISFVSAGRVIRSRGAEDQEKSVEE
ncbi:MAG: DUF3124 domain-containing protein [Elainella sp. Prado103]|jgi:hypothetical protein|nr:DUF3124 domain-containing protein [Elainella sp. Prado103]